MVTRERTFVMVKPDGVQKGVCGKVLTRFEERGLKIVALKFMRISRELAQTHYGEHVGKPFYETLLGFITSGPVLAMVIEGEDAITQARKMMGATDPKKAVPGTIRGDYGLFLTKNVVHGSDGPQSAAREIGLFFTKAELVDYHLDRDKWSYME
jgi:nucleoside-diphosphate kinase